MLGIVGDIIFKLEDFPFVKFNKQKVLNYSTKI